MADRLLRPSTHWFLGLALVVGALAYGCGRTSLDDGFGPDDGTGASGGSAAIGGQAGTSAGGMNGGGMSGGGQGGIAVGTVISCGMDKCVTGMQSCCNRFDPSGREVQMCLAITDPDGCRDGVVLCSGDILCPNVAPSCCIQAFGVGYCQPAGLPCMPLRP